MGNAGYLFEGHLTVDQEPPQPDWLVRSNLLTAAATLFQAQGDSSGEQIGNTNSVEGAASLLHELVNSLDNILPEVSFLLQPFLTLASYHTNSFLFLLIALRYC